MSNYVESKKKIESIRNKYGEPMFRCGISHLMDVGARHLTKEMVEETCKEIMQEDDSKSFMTNGFKCDLIRAAYELAQIPHIDLLVYIQREVYYDVFDNEMSYERMKRLYNNMLFHISELVSGSDLVDTLHCIGFTDDEIEMEFDDLIDEE